MRTIHASQFVTKGTSQTVRAPLAIKVSHRVRRTGCSLESTGSIAACRCTYADECRLPFKVWILSNGRSRRSQFWVMVGYKMGMAMAD